MFVMVFGTMNVEKSSAVTDTMQLIQNFVTGGLSLEAMETLGFSDITIGTATNSRANMTTFNVRDLRGTGAGWTVTAVCNQLTIDNAATGTNNIQNSAIAFEPSAATMIPLGGAVTTGMALGSDAFLSAARTFVNASAGNGMGNYKVNNTMFNIVYSGAVAQLAGTYNAIVTFELL